MKYGRFVNKKNTFFLLILHSLHDDMMMMVPFSGVVKKNKLLKSLYELGCDSKEVWLRVCFGKP